MSDQRHFFLPTRRYLTGAAGSVSGTGYSIWSTGIEWRTEVLDAAGGVLSASEQDWGQRAAVSWSSGYAQQQPANDTASAKRVVTSMMEVSPRPMPSMTPSITKKSGVRLAILRFTGNTSLNWQGSQNRKPDPGFLRSTAEANVRPCQGA